MQTYLEFRYQFGAFGPKHKRSRKHSHSSPGIDMLPRLIGATVLESVPIFFLPTVVRSRREAWTLAGCRKVLGATWRNIERRDEASNV